MLWHLFSCNKSCSDFTFLIEAYSTRGLCCYDYLCFLLDSPELHVLQFSPLGSTVYNSSDRFIPEENLITWDLFIEVTSTSTCELHKWSSDSDLYLSIWLFQKYSKMTRRPKFRPSVINLSISYFQFYLKYISLFRARNSEVIAK
jgi:hypothetical protein